MNDPLIESLRAAFDESLPNDHLCRSLARVLYEAHRYDEAEREYEEGLNHAAHDVELKTTGSG